MCNMGTVDMQNESLCSPDGTVCLVTQGDGNLVLCAPVNPRSWAVHHTWASAPLHSLHALMNRISFTCRYNETLVAMYGASAGTAIFASGTYGASAAGHPAPYSLTMQTVTLSPCCHALVKVLLGTP